MDKNHGKTMENPRPTKNGENPWKTHGKPMLKHVDVE
jgi:hypothetical protein